MTQPTDRNRPRATGTGQREATGTEPATAPPDLDRLDAAAPDRCGPD